MPSSLEADLHLFRVGTVRLGFVPETEALLRLDETGWDALELTRGQATSGDVWREVARRHGPEAAERCRAEFASLAASAGLPVAVPDPRSGPGSSSERAGDRAAWSDQAWLPSCPETPLLKALCLNVAHDCDLRCAYCFAGQGGFGGKRTLMTRQVARAAVDLLLANSGGVPACEIDFFGGEPLLNLEVVRDTVEYARRRGVETGKSFGFTLTTNAAALGPDEAAYLDATMDNVVLSLDGRPEVHDRMRPFDGGRPSHAVVLENIERFVALRGEKDYWVRGTYTAFNLDFTEDVAYLASKGIRNISLEPVVDVGARWALGPDRLPAVAAEYVRLADFMSGRAAAGQPLRFFHFIAEAESGPCYAKRVRGCGAAREYMAVTPEGDLYPCHQFVGRDGFRVGNVLDGSVRVTGPAEEVGRLWLGAKEPCRTCWARFRCSGGCHANGHLATGSILEPDPLGCALLKVRLEAALYLQTRLAESTAAT